MKLLYIGYITGPFGLKGEVKILSETMIFLKWEIVYILIIKNI